MKKIIYALAAAVLLIAPSSCNKKVEIKVVSYNIRLGVANDEENSWENRKEASPAMILDIAPDVFGLQEAYDFQFQYLKDNCPGYDGVGVPRDDGKTEGEIMAIFYNTNTIEMEKWGNFWLSETPDEPSFGWDAVCRRTATWTLMKHKASGKHFYYVNTHLDHRGKEARVNGLNLIVDRIKDINPEGWPMILTGDLNVSPDDPCLQALEGKMVSARDVAEETDHNGTYHGWGKTSSVIDYIYYSGFSSCPYFHTINETYADVPYISDHYPVTATLVF